MKTRLLAACAAAAIFASSAAPAAAALKTAVFAGGCFWSQESAMEKVKGVTNVVSGYAGPQAAARKPTYENHNGYLEAVQVTYDPAKISYAQLTDEFFHHIDPTDPNGQICDQGPAYRTAVFTADASEKQAAEAVKAKVSQVLAKTVATKVLPAQAFYPAEAYHQDYARRNPVNYNAYRIGCGRDRALKAVWGGR